MSTACLGRAQTTAASILLCGCERVPSISLVGAYFPSWMLCILIGVALTLEANAPVTQDGWWLFSAGVGAWGLGW